MARRRYAEVAGAGVRIQRMSNGSRNACWWSALLVLAMASCRAHSERAPATALASAPQQPSATNSAPSVAPEAALADALPQSREDVLGHWLGTYSGANGAQLRLAAEHVEWDCAGPLGRLTLRSSWTWSGDRIQTALYPPACASTPGYRGAGLYALRWGERRLLVIDELCDFVNQVLLESARVLEEPERVPFHPLFVHADDADRPSPGLPTLPAPWAERLERAPGRVRVLELLPAPSAERVLERRMRVDGGRERGLWVGQRLLFAGGRPWHVESVEEHGAIAVQLASARPEDAELPPLGSELLVPGRSDALRTR